MAMMEAAIVAPGRDLIVSFDKGTPVYLRVLIISQDITPVGPEDAISPLLAKVGRAAANGLQISCGDDACLADRSRRL